MSQQAGIEQLLAMHQQVIEAHLQKECNGLAHLPDTGIGRTNTSGRRGSIVYMGKCLK